MSRAHHTDVRYPHPAGCVDCRDLWLCNVCGHPAPPSERCTNGRCSVCHRAVCTPGGEVSRGHGYGTIGGAELQARTREHGGKLPAGLVITEERAASAVCNRLVFLGRNFICERRETGWHFTITEEKS